MWVEPFFFDGGKGGEVIRQKEQIHTEDTDLKLRGSVQNRENYKEKVHERHLFLMTRES